MLDELKSQRVSLRNSVNVWLFAFLWCASLPPYNLPTYCIAFAPLVWRTGCARPNVWTVLLTACVSSLAVFPFLFSLTNIFRSDGTRIAVASFGSIMFGFQVGLIAILLQYTQAFAVVPRAAFAAIGALILELIQMRIECPWPVLTISIHYVETGLAQCSDLLGWHECCWLMYFSQFLIAIEYNRSGIRKYFGIIVLSAIVFLSHIFGARFRSCHEYYSLPLNIAIIQTNRTFTEVDAITNLASVELVVFPENSIFEGVNLESSLHKWNIPVLLCGPYIEDEFYETNGFPFLTSRTTVRSQLYSRGQLVFTHSKAALVPFVERIPPVVEWVGLADLAQYFFNAGRFVPGKGSYKSFAFKARDGRSIEIGFSVCYEMYIPYMPQYRALPKPQLIVHQCNNNWIDSPIIARRHAIARAVETRSWQIVVANSHGSCIVSPSGRVVEALDCGDVMSIFLRDISK